MNKDDSEARLAGLFSGPVFEAMARGAPGSFACIDRRRRLLYVNHTRSREFSEMRGQPMEAFVEPAHRQVAVAAVERAFVNQTVEEVEYGVLLTNESRRHLRTRVIPFRGPSGDELALMLTEDITGQRHLVEELERTLEFRRLVVEHLPDFVSMVDRERRFVWVNRLAPGLTMEAVIGKPIEQFISAETAPSMSTMIDAAFDSATVGQHESQGYRDATTMGWYLVRVVPIVLEGTVANVLIITSDITERKRAEEALREAQEQLHLAQRLESLGQLAGGIAHDFNNLLQVIQGNMSFALQNVGRGKSVVEELQQAIHATQRAAELTSQLLAIGRRKRIDSKRIDLGEVVARTVRMLRRAIPENIAVKYEPAGDPYFVELDAPQFEQVLINLCVNARDAMPQGGTLTIRVGAEGDDVVMTVSDTGVGITSEQLPRIFEPFFTTKGAGSGLGLAVASGIVAAHRGSIRAESDGSSGTTIKVRLPRVAPDRAEPRIAEQPTQKEHGTILVAEDEDVVRAQVVRILESAGYTVYEAPNGARAVELYRKEGRNIDLVLLDAIMPELDGWQAYLQLRELNPDVKVVFTTGYAANVLPADFGARGPRLLSKPFRPEVLLGRIREALAP